MIFPIKSGTPWDSTAVVLPPTFVHEASTSRHHASRGALRGGSRPSAAARRHQRLPQRARQAGPPEGQVPGHLAQEAAPHGPLRHSSRGRCRLCAAQRRTSSLACLSRARRKSRPRRRAGRPRRNLRPARISATCCISRGPLSRRWRAQCFLRSRRLLQRPAVSQSRMPTIWHRSCMQRALCRVLEMRAGT